MDNGSKIENLILSVLQKHTFLTIVEIADRIGVNRLTASKYLYSLEARGVVQYRAVGNAKLFYIRKTMVKA